MWLQKLFLTYQNQNTSLDKMKKIVLITGANGMLAKHLAKQLENEYSLRFLTRNVTQVNEYLWDLKSK